MPTSSANSGNSTAQPKRGCLRSTSRRVRKTRGERSRTAANLQLNMSNLVFTPEEVVAQGHPDSAFLAWQHQHNQAQHAIAEGDAVSEHEFMNEAAAAHQGSAHPIRAESSAKPRSAPYEREERELSPPRQSSVSRARLSSRSPSPAPSTIPECYIVTSDVEDDYSRPKSTAQLN